ncbi:MAG: hypothetical protein LBJ46_04195 [Planctomycetota bacterium]|jgi:tetratricopeptide (TPR) repeat protein|nr:hypothetical protein [Planctomycetota bacterium]
MRRISVFFIRLFLALALGARGTSPAVAAETNFAAVDARLGVARRLVEGEFHRDALPVARSVLDDPALIPGVDGERLGNEALSRREEARFLLERARLGVARDNGGFLDVAGEFVLLSQNRYRLAEPKRAVESAFWAGRAFQQAGEYGSAVAMYGRVGGVSLPENMEGEAARRLSECLRLMAEDLPYPGSRHDRDERRRLLDRAIDELARARRAFPVGRGRKELELDLIALRLARREPDLAREALAEADVFLATEAVKDDLRARATLYRALAAERLGQLRDAAEWYRLLLADENPAPDALRDGRLGLAVVLRELAANLEADARQPLLVEAVQAFRDALDDAPRGTRLDQARVLMASTLLDMGSPREALSALQPLLNDSGSPRTAYHLAGAAQMALGHYGQALPLSTRAALPSTGDRDLRLSAAITAARAARALGDFGTALAFDHETSRLYRRDLAFSSLLESEFAAMETRLGLGKAGGPVSLSSDAELLRAGGEEAPRGLDDWRRSASEQLLAALGGALAPGGGADAGFRLALAAESAHAWGGAGEGDLEIALGVIRHLRSRRPPGITEGSLLSREGEAFHALARARAERILEADEPDAEGIERALGRFTLAAMSYRAAAGGLDDGADLLDQGVVNLESGEFLLRLAERWPSGRRTGNAMDWRMEARRRLEASLAPFNRIIRNARRVSSAVMRARWSRAHALELLGEWREAAAGYLRLMNDSEAPRILRVNSARHWARARLELGGDDLGDAVERVAVFAAADADTALLAGGLAEESGDYPRAYAYFLFAADPGSPSLPPETPGRPLVAARKAAGLALERPAEAAPDVDPGTLRRRARDLLERTAYSNLSGPWAEGILRELIDSWLGEGPDGWRTAVELAMRAASDSRAPAPLRRAMLILAADALRTGGEYAQALDRLDEAREFLSDGESERERLDMARIVLAAARVYSAQGRRDDALRAYAEAFAAYPEAEECADAARVEAAKLLLSGEEVGERERNQARSVLAGLRDRALAEEILGDR